MIVASIESSLLSSKLNNLPNLPFYTYIVEPFENIIFDLPNAPIIVQIYHCFNENMLLKEPTFRCGGKWMISDGTILEVVIAQQSLQT